MLSEKYEKRIRAHWPKEPKLILSKDEIEYYRVAIKKLLKKQDAVIVAHFYVDSEIQKLTEETGGAVADSLAMAKFGADHPAKRLIVAGVGFMGETAKILSPEKRVFMPTLEATCSLDLSCQADEFAEFCAKHPDRTVVVYANTSVAVKALSDWVVTSSCALDIISKLKAEGQKFIWAPDRLLGGWIQRETGADMLIWDGACIVHAEFSMKEINALMAQHPDALLLAHPESPEEVLAVADVVGSTSQLLNATKTLSNKTFIVATDNGIFHKMKESSPDKTFIPALSRGVGATCRSCAACPWMGMNNLKDLYESLLEEKNEILIDEAIRARALVALDRMVKFK